MAIVSLVRKLSKRGSQIGGPTHSTIGKVTPIEFIKEPPWESQTARELTSSALV